MHQDERLDAASVLDQLVVDATDHVPELSYSHHCLALVSCLIKLQFEHSCEPGSFDCSRKSR